MTDQEIIIAVAKSLGYRWRSLPWNHPYAGFLGGEHYWFDVKGNPVIALPNYPNDLNACRQFEEGYVPSPTGRTLGEAFDAAKKEITD